MLRISPSWFDLKWIFLRYLSTFVYHYILQLSFFFQSASMWLTEAVTFEIMHGYWYRYLTQPICISTTSALNNPNSFLPDLKYTFLPVLPRSVLTTPASSLSNLLLSVTDEDEATTSGVTDGGAAADVASRVIFVNRPQPQKFLGNRISTAKYRWGGMRIKDMGVRGPPWCCIKDHSVTTAAQKLLMCGLCLNRVIFPWEF